MLFFFDSLHACAHADFFNILDDFWGTFAFINANIQKYKWGLQADCA